MEHFTISEWLKSIGCDRYTNAFISNNCTTKEAVSSLTAQQLQQWGVDRSEDDYGRRILKATRSLLQQSEEEATQEYLVRKPFVCMVACHVETAAANVKNKK